MECDACAQRIHEACTGETKHDGECDCRYLDDEIHHPRRYRMTETSTEPTDAQVEAFTTAWEAENKKIGRGIAPKGTRVRAGLQAVLALRDTLYDSPKLVVEYEVLGFEGRLSEEEFLNLPVGRYSIYRRVVTDEPR